MSKSPNQLHVVTALHAVRDKVQLVPQRVAETAVALLVKPHARVAMMRAPVPAALVAMMLHPHVGTISHRHVVTMAHPLVVMIVQYAMNREPVAVLRAIRARAAVAPRVVTNQARTELHVAMSRVILVQVVVRMIVRVAILVRHVAMSRAMHALRAEMMTALVVMTRVQRADLLAMTALVVTMHAEHQSGQQEVARNLIAHAANDQRVIVRAQIDLVRIDRVQIDPRLARRPSRALRSHAHAVRRKPLALV